MEVDLDLDMDMEMDLDMDMDLEMDKVYHLIHDSNPDMPSITSSNLDEVRHLNVWRGYGVFQTVNKFKGKRRIKSNLEEIRAWYVDLDGDKEHFQNLIDFGSTPSKVVESKNGYHIYFYSNSPALENYNRIEMGLINYYGGDPRAKDICRILRAPGFYHMKDPINPFLVSIKSEYGHKYTEKEMLRSFPYEEQEFIREVSDTTSYGDGDIFSKIHALDCKEVLEKLSGTKWVNGEHFTFCPISTGEGIIVDGKRVHCWIDRYGRIGTMDGSGPTALHWLTYYGHSKSDAIAILQQLYPELVNEVVDFGHWVIGSDPKGNNGLEKGKGD